MQIIVKKQKFEKSSKSNTTGKWIIECVGLSKVRILVVNSLIYTYQDCSKLILVIFFYFCVLSRINNYEFESMTLDKFGNFLVPHTNTFGMAQDVGLSVTLLFTVIVGEVLVDNNTYLQDNSYQPSTMGGKKVWWNWWVNFQIDSKNQNHTCYPIMR